MGSTRRVAVPVRLPTLSLKTSLNFVMIGHLVTSVASLFLIAAILSKFWLFTEMRPIFWLAETPRTGIRSSP